MFSYCSQCNVYTLSNNLKLHSSICYECHQLNTNPDSTDHRLLIRCPKCSLKKNIYKFDELLDGIFTEGEHTVICENCSEEFKIGTSVQYTFTSPQRNE